MLLLLKSNLKCDFRIVQFTTCVPVAGCQFGMIMPTKLCFSFSHTLLLMQQAVALQSSLGL